jgi:Glycosyl transferase family 90
MKRRKTIRSSSSTILYDKPTTKSLFRRNLLVWIPQYVRPSTTSAPRSRRDIVLLRSTTIWLLLASVLVYACVDLYLSWRWRPKYASRSERDFRRQRFPSVEDRVRVYMTNWYKPPCDDTGKVVFQRKVNSTARALSVSRWRLFRGNNIASDQYYFKMTELEDASAPRDEVQRTVVLNNQFQIGRMFTIDKTNLKQCFAQRRLNIRFYCSDSSKSILDTAMPDIGWGRDDPLPILCQFGDETASFAQDISDTSSYQLNPRIPHIKKIRLALSRKQLDQLALQEESFTGDGPREECHRGPRGPPAGMSQMQPILWLLNVNRHFKYSWDIRRYDIPWEDKRDAAVFRGLLTGLEYDAQATDEVNCRNLIRCGLVLDTSQSSIVDAKLTSTFGKIPDVFQGVNMTGPQLLKEELLAYKGFIILEGNDVSSGLKWAMVSHSVVLMPPPRFTSWSMEEFLEPWVHYIPLRPDLADVEEKTQWMLDHQSEAKRISLRANLWVLDLYYHPDAMKDNRLINQEVLRRYRAHFRLKTSDT